MKKADRLKKIRTTIIKLEFEDKIPDSSSLDLSQIKIISGYYKKIVNVKVVMGVIIDVCFQKVLKTNEAFTKGKKKLDEIESIDIDILTKDIDALLSSLPLKYDFYFLMPKSKKAVNKKISWNVELLTVNKELKEKYFSKRNESGLFRAISGRQPKTEIKEGDVILKVSGNGYVDKYGVILLDIVDPLFIFKSLIGIYLATEVLVYSKKESPNYYIGRQFDFTVFNDSKEVREFYETHDDFNFLKKLEFNSNKQELSDLDKLLDKKKDFFTVVSNNISLLLKNSKIKKTVSGFKPLEQVRGILNSGYWLYETEKSNQSHTKAIYLTTAIDALTRLKGTSDTKENKALLISNQIANNASEAFSISKDIVELYVFRNMIVHGEESISTVMSESDIRKEDRSYIVYKSVYYLFRYFYNRFFFVSNGFEK